MKESVLVDKIKKHIAARGGKPYKIWGGGFQAAGVPDILICYKGIFIGCEVKIGNGKPSEVQLYELHEIKKSGGIAILTWDLETVERVLDLIDKGESIEHIQSTLHIPERTTRQYIR